MSKPGIAFPRQFLLIFLTTAGLVAINLVWLVPTIRNIRSSASTLALEIGQRAASEISFSINSSLRDLAQSAEEIAEDPEKLESALQRLLKHNFALQNAALVESNGLEILRIDRLKTVSPNDLREHSKDAYLYLALQGASTVGQVFISPELEPYATLAAPVSHLGDIKQVLIADLNLRDFVSIATTPQLERGRIYVVDSSGFQIIHPNLAELLRRPNYSGRAIIQKVLFDGRLANGLAPDDSYLNEAGEKTFTVGIPIAAVGWGLFVEQPRTQAFRGERQAIAFAVITTILGILVLLTITRGNLRLGQLNTALNSLLRENYESAKMLVRRDLELSEANVRLQELDAVKSEFVSVAAHQLRTPLTGIRWSYHALLEEDSGKLGAEQREIIEKGLRASLSMIELINNLLNVARLEEGRFGFEFKRQSILPIAEKSYREFKEAAEEKGVILKLGTPRVMPAVNIDGEKMAIALDNLLDNAIKYTPPAGEVVLKISSSPKKNAVEITVKDSGIGVPKGQMHRLFTKFFRADNAMLLETMGNGLGLYVAKNIIERHGGEIKVESAEGQGTTFTVTLPVREQ